MYSRSGRSHMCRLACNVCGGITAVVFSRRRFFDLTLLWISGLAWYPSCPITFGKIPSSGLQCTLWFIYLHVGHLSAVFTTSHHHLCSTEVSSASVLSPARSVTTSTNIERHRQSPPTVSRVSNTHNKKCSMVQVAIPSYCVPELFGIT